MKKSKITYIVYNKFVIIVMTTFQSVYRKEACLDSVAYMLCRNSDILIVKPSLSSINPLCYLSVVKILK